MAANSAIEWTDATWNPWQGCTKVSEACANCYMFSDMRRYGKDPTVVRKSKDPTFFLPLKRRRGGEFALAPGSKVFTCSWSDWFHERADAWRPKAFSIIQQRPDLVFQILTKRPERIAECLPPDWGEGYPNVWLGVTAENQQRADERIPWLIRTPAAVRFLSCEPLLGPIDLWQATGGFRICEHCRQLGPDGLCCSHCARTGFALSPLGLVIVGGESGHQARPMHPDWARSLRDQCQAAGVPFFFKQWGEWHSGDRIAPTLRAKATNGFVCPSGCFSESVTTASLEQHSRQCTASRFGAALSPMAMYRIGKQAAGRLLDGREWSEFPNEQSLPFGEAEGSFAEAVKPITILGGN